MLAAASMIAATGTLAACGGEETTSTSARQTTTSVGAQTTTTGTAPASPVMQWTDVAPWTRCRNRGAGRPWHMTWLLKESFYSVDGMLTRISGTPGPTTRPPTRGPTSVSPPGLLPGRFIRWSMTRWVARSSSLAGRVIPAATPTPGPTTSAANMWTDLSGPVAPSARSVHQMVYDSTLGKIILFGGYGTDSGSLATPGPTTTATNTWTDLQPAGDVPSPRRAHAMAYDPVLRSCDPLRGVRRYSVLDDTWAYDPSNNTWTRAGNPAGVASASRGPTTGWSTMRLPARWSSSAATTARTDLYDTWAYDPRTNIGQISTPLGPPPPAREEHAMVYLP